MRVTKLKLIDRGHKGSDVTYERTEEVKGLHYNNGIKKRNKAPVPIEMKNTMRKLKFAIADLCGLWDKRFDDYYDKEGFRINSDYTPGKEDIDGPYGLMKDMLDRLEVKEVWGLSDNFKIKAVYRMADSHKKVKIETDKVTEEDGFTYYDEVHELIVDELFSDTIKYVEGKLTADARQFVLDIMTDDQGSDKETAIKEVEEMDKEEKQQYMTDWLEKNGSIVMHQEDHEEGDGREEDVIYEEGVEDKASIDTGEDMNDKKKGKIKEMATTVEESDERDEVPADNFESDSVGF